MKYPTIESADARRYLAGKRDGLEELRDPTIVWKGDGEELSSLYIDAVRKKFAVFMEKYGAERSDKENSQFEAEAAVMLHQLLPIESAVAADPGFWMWLAVSQFGDVVEWRYSSAGAQVNLKNYGIGARAENLLYRLWLRAEIALDEASEDRYDLVRRGQVDFWRSHILRQGYASVPAMARALIRYQYPDELKGAPRLNIAAIRELAPLMKRLRANLMYEFLDEAQCMHLLQSEGARIADKGV